MDKEKKDGRTNEPVVGQSAHLLLYEVSSYEKIYIGALIYKPTILHSMLLAVSLTVVLKILTPPANTYTHIQPPKE